MHATIAVILTSVLAVVVTLPMTTEVVSSADVLLVSFHGGDGEQNVPQVFDINGTKLGPAVNVGASSLRETRGMMLHSNGSLLIANAYKDDSRVALFSPCVNGQRNFQSNFVSASQNSGVQHPYAMAASSTALYVSNQDDALILRFDLTTGEPLPSPAGTPSGLPPGTFLQREGGDLRGLAFDNNGHLWIADDSVSHVFVYTEAGERVGKYKADNPVSFAYDGARTMYVSCKGDDTIRGIDIDSGEQVTSFSDKLLDHPTGLALQGDNLYALSQNTKKLLLFSLTTQKLSKTLADLEDLPENLLLTNGC